MIEQDVSTLTAARKPANVVSWLNLFMTLSERLAELMQAKSWTRRDLQQAAGVSSSVVSQWLGKGTKEIKSIGDTAAAERLAQATGYALLWIAKGQGPKKSTTATRAAPAPATTVLKAEEPAPPGPRFADRMQVSPSDWALLQDIKVAATAAELADLRARAAHAREVVRHEIEAAKNGGGK
jgi:transcriptional regulator with XRE-family HTH domain